ncbi:MAG TPA: ribonuclease HI [Blastocatellia bacterium]|nr:ribonuclease HI [Blastocatellia bacterium]
MAKSKHKFYAVRKGYLPAIYTLWEDCAAQVKGYPGAEYKGFSTLEEAEEYMGWNTPQPDDADEELKQGAGDWDGSFHAKTPRCKERKGVDSEVSRFDVESDEGLKKVILYTDGSAIYNPGPGGYGVVLIHGKHRKEMSGGFRLTTNNRMEIMACIVGLRALKGRCAVTLYTDSQYVVNGIMRGWAQRWKRGGWQKGGMEVPNADLWEQLLDLCDRHEVTFQWVRGHAGNKENERCDQLARQAALGNALAVDTAYEAKIKQQRV